MKVIALINSAAGGVTPDGKERMQRALKSNGIEAAEIIEFDPAAADLQLTELAKQDADFLVAWGGDGTHRSILKTLGQRAKRIILLPGGTMNLLTRALHGGRRWDAALRAVLASPAIKDLPAGRIQDEPFFCAMLAGLPARLAGARESLRHGDVIEAIDKARIAFDAAKDIHLVTHFASVSGGPSDDLPQSSVIGALVGSLAHNGRMEVAFLSDSLPRSGLDVVWASLHAGWRNLPGVTTFPAETLTIDDRDGREISVIVDGEIIRVGPRLQATFVERAAQCLVAG